MSRLFVDPDIAKAHTIHTDFYTSPLYFEQAKEKIFANCWQYAGCIDQLSTPGAFPFILLPGYLNEPLVITQDEKNNLKCLSNVCTHRGNILVNEPCTLNRMRCKYHGRVFSLDGKFISMPEFKEVENFPTDADNLHQLPFFRWEKLLFTSIHPKFKAKDFFDDMMERIHWLPLNDLKFRPELSKDYHVKANWALYCENYLEGFHIPFVHAGLNAELDFGSYSTEISFYSSLQLGIAKKDEACFDIPESAVDFGKKVAAYYFWVFPNLMFNFYPWGLSLNVVNPTGISESKVSFLTFVFDESKLGQGAGSGLDTVEMEDEYIVERVQAGIRSRFYSKGRYSVKHEKGTHHFHTLIANFMQ